MARRKRRGSRRLRKRSLTGRRVKHMRRKGRPLMSTAAGPWIVIGIVAFFALVVTLSAVFLIVPIFTREQASPIPTLRPLEAAASPEKPHGVQLVELGTLQKEINPGVRYVADPWFCDGTLVFAGGVDELGNSKMHTIFTCDTAGNGSVQELITHPRFDDFACIRMNEKWLAFVDVQREGAGSIKVMERETGEVRLVKDYFAGQPTISLDGDVLVWTERTGTYMDKLYVYDIPTGEQITLATFENNRYGLSDPHMANGVIVWAEADDTRAEGEAARSVIRSVVLGKGGAPSSFAAGTYVHDPMTNGTHTVWLDSDHEAGANLYMYDGRNEPVIIADDVAVYGITDEFLAYNRKSEIYVYFFEDGYEQLITPSSEQAILAAVADDAVIWYETGISSRDVLKYAVID